MTGDIVHRRRFSGGDLTSLIVSLGAMIGTIAIFPSNALSFRPSAVRVAESSCAFVTLSADELERAEMAVRVSWLSHEGSRVAMRPNVFPATLPVLPLPRLGSSVAQPSPDAAIPPYEPELAPPSCAAPPPMAIVPQPQEPKRLPFAREEMLKLPRL